MTARDTTPLVRRQVRLFLLVSVVAMSLLAVSYIRLPQLLGVGRYELDVRLEGTGGLYPRSAVTYRGVEIGTVTSLDLDAEGLVAHLSIEDDARIPRASTAVVSSSSVIGEQYLDFVPTAGASVREVWDDGDTVPQASTRLPTTTGELLTSVDGLLASIPPASLRSLVTETGQAFDGSRQPLGRFLDDGTALLHTARENLPQTTDLIDRGERVLATQRDLDPRIRRLTRSADDLTGQLAADDADLRELTDTGDDTVVSIRSYLKDVVPPLSDVLDDVADVSEVAGVFRDGIEHILTVLPAAATMYAAGTRPEEFAKPYARTNLYFKSSVPSVCTRGFPEADRLRDPTDLSEAPLPKDSYCKVPSDSTLVVRGARNSPCPDGVRRGATAAACGVEFGPTRRSRSIEAALRSW